jgi:hypothetical protein
MHLGEGLNKDAVLLPVAERLQQAARLVGTRLELVCGPADHPGLALRATKGVQAPAKGEGYALEISAKGISLAYFDEGGLRAGAATLRQLLRGYGRKLPCLKIRDWPDFARRGVMLDISRGRVPRLETLLDLVERLADLKINEFQMYLEHTFAYRNYEPVWKDWGALTGEEILKLDARCRQLGIDLVPNQNSFGHLRAWLKHPSLRPLAEIPEPYEDGGGAFLRYPSTLAPNHPDSLTFLRGLYDELLPHFSSGRFNVGCDETWDLGRGQSRKLCERKGKGRVYLEFLRKIHREVASRGLRMMFWGDIILNHPELLPELPKDLIALNWGYEKGHPFERETALFERSGVPYYVCPGTSTWMTLIGRHDNALANLGEAARAGMRHGAQGYLITDWGDGGHPQPLAVSFPLFLAGAARAWCGASYDQALLAPVLSRDLYEDGTGKAAAAALALGRAHRLFQFSAPNQTPFGTVLTAYPPERRELFCRDGLTHFERISEENIRMALAEVKQQRQALARATPESDAGAMWMLELDMAARMAAQSCEYMLWQQAVAAGRGARARKLAEAICGELILLEEDFGGYWPLRNKGGVEKCAAFLRWRRLELQVALG